MKNSLWIWFLAIFITGSIYCAQRDNEIQGIEYVPETYSKKMHALDELLGQLTTRNQKEAMNILARNLQAYALEQAVRGKKIEATKKFLKEQILIALQAGQNAMGANIQNFSVLQSMCNPEAKMTKKDFKKIMEVLLSNPQFIKTLGYNLTRNTKTCCWDFGLQCFALNASQQAQKMPVSQPALPLASSFSSLSPEDQEAFWAEFLEHPNSSKEVIFSDV